MPKYPSSLSKLSSMIKSESYLIRITVTILIKEFASSSGNNLFINDKFILSIFLFSFINDDKSFPFIVFIFNEFKHLFSSFRFSIFS